MNNEYSIGDDPQKAGGKGVRDVVGGRIREWTLTVRFRLHVAASARAAGGQLGCTNEGESCTSPNCATYLLPATLVPCSTVILSLLVRVAASRTSYTTRKATTPYRILGDIPVVMCTTTLPYYGK